jgi:hypothetical protein
MLALTFAANPSMFDIYAAFSYTRNRHQVHSIDRQL